MIQGLINRYKRMRTEHYLRQTYRHQYAFVGMGQHSLTNLYPVLNYLGVPVKYICVTSGRKARLIEQKFPGVKATTSLNEILQDEAVKGVFVSTSPSSHFSIASQVLRSGKSIFIEKPPCQTMEELDTLIDLQRLHGSPVAMVGLQRRYAPAIQLLKKSLCKEHLISYDLHYVTGAYPEGNALLDLYIHPLDLVCLLFGKPEILAAQRVTKDSYLIMLRHTHIVGTLELSTAYSWTDAEESLKICTKSGIYQLRQLEELTFTPTPFTVFGIPLEKLHTSHETKEILYQRNNLTPILADNQIYSQGYFNEMEAFVNAIEGRNNTIATDIKTIRETYRLISEIQTDKIM